MAVRKSQWNQTSKYSEVSKLNKSNVLADKEDENKKYNHIKAYTFAFMSMFLESLAHIILA